MKESVFENCLLSLLWRDVIAIWQGPHLVFELIQSKTVGLRSSLSLHPLVQRYSGFWVQFRALLACRIVPASCIIRTKLLWGNHHWFSFLKVTPVARKASYLIRNIKNKSSSKAEHSLAWSQAAVVFLTAQDHCRVNLLAGIQDGCFSLMYFYKDRLIKPTVLNHLITHRSAYLPHLSV